MKPINIVVTALLLMMVGSGCNRKSHPTVSNTPAVETPATPNTKPVRRSVPKVITVNDKAAKRSLDGRYYYDLQGHRYWRNNRDGKYYLFHQSMFDNPDFKGTGN